jgi:hypothetical protein
VPLCGDERSAAADQSVRDQLPGPLMVGTVVFAPAHVRVWTRRALA